MIFDFEFKIKMLLVISVFFISTVILRNTH